MREGVREGGRECVSKQQEIDKTETKETSTQKQISYTSRVTCTCTKCLMYTHTHSKQDLSVSNILDHVVI